MKTNRLVVPAFCLLFLLAGLLSPTRAAEPRTHFGRESFWCGTWDWGIEVALAKHELNRRRLGRELRVQSERTGEFETKALEVEPEGNVAVIRDDGSLIVVENSFDYQNRGAKFVRRRQNGYKFRNLDRAFRADLGEKLDLGDDDAVRVDLPDFEITFFGDTYSSLYVNSDGNLTFGRADTASTSRDLRRLLNGQPRVAPFFADLDPSAATGDGGVYLRLANNRIIVTWWQVPEFGKTNRSTFQMSMNRRGNVEVLFGEMMAREGIVGVAPGGGSGLELVDLSEDLPIKRRGLAMAERFTEEESLDEASVAAAFYENFADDYDQLVMFTDFGMRAQDSAIAYHITVKNTVRGIGKSIHDGTRFFASNGRLGGFINMGGQIQYSSDITRPTFFDVYSATDILAHEIGHQWLVRATFVDPRGRESRDLLGRDSAHWNFYFDSDLSFMEGNEIRDDGNSRFTTLRKRATYNPFDRYLMGLIPASEVPDKFYVELTSDGPDASEVPVQPGVSFSGQRLDVSIDQIIASLGARSPSVEESQKEFRLGFIVLVKQGQQPNESTVDKVNRIANEIGRLFSQATGRRGSLDTTLLAR